MSRACVIAEWRIEAQCPPSGKMENEKMRGSVSPWYPSDYIQLGQFFTSPSNSEYLQLSRNVGEKDNPPFVVVF